MANSNTINITLKVNDDGSVVIEKFGQNAEKALDKTSTAAKGAGNSITGMRSSMDGIDSMVNRAFGAAAITLFVDKMLDASMATSRINSAMSATMGSGQATARELQFVRDEATRLGLDMNNTSLAFAKFAASTKNTAVEGEETRRIFTGVSEAVTAMQLPTEEANGIFLALSQMMSKGRISAEELNGQLGERLPGALQLTADALGMTTAELLKNMQEGKLMSADVLPALADQLHKTYGESATKAAQEGRAEINRFNNELKGTAAYIGDVLMPMITLLGKGGSALFSEIRSQLADKRMSFADLSGGVEKVGATIMMLNERFNEFGVDSESVMTRFEARLKNIDAGVLTSKRNIMGAAGAAALSAKSLEQLFDEEESLYKKKSKASNDAKNKETEEATKKHLDQRIKLAEQAAKKEREIWEETADAIAAAEFDAAEKEGDKELKFWTDLADEIAKAEFDAAEKAGENELKFWTDLSNDIANAEYAAAEKRGEASRDLYKDLQGYENQYFAASVALINDQAERYRALGVDKVAVEQWVLQETQKLEIQKLKASSDWKDGVKAHLLELQQNTTTWGNASYATVQAFTQNAQKQLSDNLFNIMKGRFNEIGVDWSNLWDSALSAFSNKLSQMVVDAAAKKVYFYFESKVSDALGGILSTLASWGTSYLLNNGTGSGTGTGTGTGSGFDGPLYHEAHGGYIPGVARVAGDSYANDTVRAYVSPGEYIEPRSAVNADTIGMLEYIREWGALPAMYAEGGIVNSSLADLAAQARALTDAYLALYPNGYQITMDNSQGVPDEAMPRLLGYYNNLPVFGGGAGLGVGTGLLPDYSTYFGTYYNIDAAGNLTTGENKQYTGGGFLSGLFDTLISAGLSAGTGGLSDLYSAATGASNIWDFVDRLVDPGGSVDYSLRNIGEQMPDWLREAAPTIGGIIGSIMGPWMAAAGAGAGAKIAGQDTRTAMETASLAALFTYMSSGSEGVDWKQAASNLAKSEGKKLIVQEIMELINGGGLGISFAGMDDNGLFSSIGQSLSDLTGGSNFGFTLAKNGLDYVPYDGYRILAHEGESVLPAGDAAIWRTAKAYAEGGLVGSDLNLSASSKVLKKQLSEELEDAFDAAFKSAYLSPLDYAFSGHSADSASWHTILAQQSADPAKLYQRWAYLQKTDPQRYIEEKLAYEDALNYDVMTYSVPGGDSVATWRRNTAPAIQTATGSFAASRPAVSAASSTTSSFAPASESSSSASSSDMSDVIEVVAAFQADMHQIGITLIDHASSIKKLVAKIDALGVSARAS